MQAQFGVDRPDFGVLFDDMACAPGTPIDRARTLQPKIEAEIAFVLAEDLAGPMIGPAEVAAATAYVVAALEIVDSRIAGLGHRHRRHDRRQRLLRPVRARRPETAARSS